MKNVRKESLYMHVCVQQHVRVRQHDRIRQPFVMGAVALCGSSLEELRKSCARVARTSSLVMSCERVARPPRLTRNL